MRKITHSKPLWDNFDNITVTKSNYGSNLSQVFLQLMVRLFHLIVSLSLFVLCNYPNSSVGATFATVSALLTPFIHLDL